jgi:hypothetical protein
VGAAGVTSCTEVHRLWKVMGQGSTWIAACIMEGPWAEADLRICSCRLGLGRPWAEARRSGTGLWDRTDAPCRLEDRRWGEEEEEARRPSEGAGVVAAGSNP